MKIELLHITVNGKKVLINTLTDGGIEYINGTHYVILEDLEGNNVCLFFEFNEEFRNNVTNYGDGDIYFKTKEIELTELAFIVDLDVKDNIYLDEYHIEPTPEMKEKVLKTVQSFYYNIEEI